MVQELGVIIGIDNGVGMVGLYNQNEEGAKVLGGKLAGILVEDPDFVSSAVASLQVNNVSCYTMLLLGGGTLTPGGK